MMTSPEMYIKELQNKTYSELLQEKEKLINEINNLDKNSSYKPSYKTIYNIQQEYLKKIDELIKSKSNMV